MGDLIYLPAINLSYIDEGEHVVEMYENVGFGHNFLFNDKRSAFYYPYFLISYYYGKSCANIREKYGLKNVFIKGDSGGFQNITMDANLDPLELIKWQQVNCDSGLILDVPPFKKIEGSAQFGESTDEVFKEALNKTILNAKVGLANWTKPEFKLFGVIQGDSVKRQEVWLASMLKVEAESGKKFAGWSLSPKPSHDIKQIATHAANLIDKKITDKPIHILQISGFESLAMAAYVSKFFSADVTVDSSTFNVGRVYFTYFNPYDFLDKWDFGSRDTVQFKSVGCDCPVCTRVNYRFFSYDAWKYKSPPGILIALHNLYQIIKYTRFLNSLKDDEVLFRRFCKKYFGQSFLNMCDYVKEVSLHGKQDSYRKNVVKSEKLTSYFSELGEPEVNTVEIKKERLESIQKEFPGITGKAVELIYKQRWEAF